MRAATHATIGRSSEVTVEGSLSLTSTGDPGNSVASIGRGSDVAAETVRIEASRRAHIGSTVALLAESVAVLSAGYAELGWGAQVFAGELAVEARRRCTVGRSSSLTAGSLSLVATDTEFGTAIFRQGADVVAAEALVSGPRQAVVERAAKVAAVGEIWRPVGRFSVARSLSGGLSGDSLLRHGFLAAWRPISRREVPSFAIASTAGRRRSPKTASLRRRSRRSIAGRMRPPCGSPRWIAGRKASRCRCRRSIRRVTAPGACDRRRPGRLGVDGLWETGPPDAFFPLQPGRGGPERASVRGWRRGRRTP